MTAPQATTEQVLCNRRSEPRVRLQQQFRMSVNGDERVLQATNLSIGGAFFQSDLHFILGTEIKISIEVDGTSVGSRAHIVHRTRHGFGITFVDPSTDFTYALIAAIWEHIAENVEHGATADQIPARVALILNDERTERVLYTAGLNPAGVWVLTNQPETIPDTVELTLSEHGIFDCKARVVWRGQDSVGLEFITPGEEFRIAFQRILDAFLCNG